MSKRVMKLEPGEELEPEAEARARPAATAGGVAIGLLMGFDEAGAPLVVYPGNPNEEAVPARATARLSPADVGCEVALLFEDGEPSAYPLLIGRILKGADPVRARLRELEIQLADERLELSARREVVIRCGKASITLTPAGKVLIRGTYISSRSSGANRIKGGSVQLN